MITWTATSVNNNSYTAFVQLATSMVGTDLQFGTGLTKTGITLTLNANTDDINESSNNQTTGKISIGQSVGTSDSVTFTPVTTNLTGNVTGDVTAHLTGEVIGDVTRNLIG